MSTSKLALIAATMLSMGIVVYTQDPAYAARRWCAQVQGEEHPDCSFRTMGECRHAARERGGGRCYAWHHGTPPTAN